MSIMSNLFARLAGFRPIIRPLADYGGRPASYMITRAIGQGTLYLIALILVLAVDMLDSPKNDKALLRDLAAGIMTSLLAGAISD